MYVDLDEKRVISRKTYTNNERVDLYLKGSCVLDRSLKINNMGGVKLLTHNKSFIDDSLRRIGYEELEVVEIPFSLNVPKGIPFYSAHYKVDVFGISPLCQRMNIPSYSIAMSCVCESFLLSITN